MESVEPQVWLAWLLLPGFKLSGVKIRHWAVLGGSGVSGGAARSSGLCRRARLGSPCGGAGRSPSGFRVVSCSYFSVPSRGDWVRQEAVAHPKQVAPASGLRFDQATGGAALQNGDEFFSELIAIARARHCGSRVRRLPRWEMV